MHIILMHCYLSSFLSLYACVTQEFVFYWLAPTGFNSLLLITPNSSGQNLLKKELPSDTERVQSAPIYWQYISKRRKFDNIC